MSLEIRPLAVLYPSPHTKSCFIGLWSQASLSISALSGRRGRYAHSYGICTPLDGEVLGLSPSQTKDFKDGDHNELK